MAGLLATQGSPTVMEAEERPDRRVRSDSPRTLDESWKPAATGELHVRGPGDSIIPVSLDSLFPSEGELFEDRITVASRDTIVSDLTPEELTRSRPLLLRLDGPDAGQVVSLLGDRFQIGRHPSAEVTIDDRGVSRIHARIYFQEGTCWVKDLGSVNGTFVKGQKVTHCSLTDGDVIQLGPRVSFRYSLVDGRQEELLRQMYQSSTRDALTGIHNRQHLNARMQSEVAFAVRHEASVAVVLFDIDHFKQINDTHGHLAGDRVLCHVAHTLERSMRSEDLLARYGGEEFVALLRGADIKAAYKMAERMRVTVAKEPAVLQTKRIPVTVSAGCAALACTAEFVPEALIAVSDRRLYAAKRAGRNRVIWRD